MAGACRLCRIFFVVCGAKGVMLNGLDSFLIKEGVNTDQLPIRHLSHTRQGIISTCPQVSIVRIGPLIVRL